MDRALELQPDSASVLQDKATALVLHGQGKRRLGAVPPESAGKKDPDNALVMSNLAWTLAKVGKRQLTPGRKPGQKIPGTGQSQNPRYWNTLGTVYTAQTQACPRPGLLLPHLGALDPNFPKVNQRILSSVKELTPFEIIQTGRYPPGDAPGLRSPLMDPDADEARRSTWQNPKI
jgi:hypothetical protein